MLTKIFVKILIFVVFASSLQNFGQSQDRGVGNKIASPKRLALVIGNSSYKSKEDFLPNPMNDARAMEKTLKELGFEVILGIDADKAKMRSQIREFGDKLAQTKAIGLFFYAGHGVAVDGTNYLIPIDADIPSEDEVDDDAIPIKFLLDKMELAGNPLNMLFLDACRNNPFARKWRTMRDKGANGGLTKIDTQGTMIFYATEYGKTAADGKDTNSPFTKALVKNIILPNVEFEKMFRSVINDVVAETKGQQKPWKEGTYAGGDFFFKKINETEQIEQKFSGEQAFWQEAERRNNVEFYEAYISNYPKGEYNRLANFKIQELKTKAKAYVSEAIKFTFENRAKAIELCSKAIELYPKYERAYMGRGRYYSLSNEYDKAIADYTKILEFNSESEEAYYKRGEVYLTKKQFYQALSDTKKAVELNPNFVYNYILRGRSYAGLGEYNSAIADFNKALVFNSTDRHVEYNIYTNRGIAYLKKQEYDLAIVDLTKVIESKSPYSKVESHNNRGKAYFGKKLYNLAIADFTKAIENSWRAVEFYENRALAYEAIGELTKAIADRQKADDLKRQQK